MRASFVSKSAAALKVQQSAGPLKTKLKNGLTVVAQDNGGAVSQLILAFRAGSRYQSVTQQGLVHHIRNFVGRDAQSYPGLQLIWSAAAAGAKMNAFSSRDVFGVHVSVPRDSADYALSILGHLTARPAYKPWEIDDVTPTIHADLAQTTPYTVVFEDIHAAAFRNDSLANSNFSKKRMIGKFGADEMKSFALKHFTTGNGVLVGLNVDSETLLTYGDENGAIREGVMCVNHLAPFRGGDHRRYARRPDVHVMIAGAAPGVSETSQLAAQHVLSAHIGYSTPISYSNQLPILQYSGCPGAAFSANYDGSGLVGAYLHTAGKNAETAVKKTVEAFRKAQIKDLEECKRRAINSILFNAENAVLTGMEYATGALFKGKDQSELIDEIRKVDQKSIDSFVKNSFEKVAISAYGSCETVPYSDEI